MRPIDDDLTAAPVVVVVTIPERNHFTLLESLIAGVAAEGATVYVLGDRQNAVRIERAGATFVDLYGRYSLDEADDESVPLPSRFVTYAARYADDVSAEVAALAPDVIVHDVFAVIGRVVASELGVPRVVVFPGHDLDPRRFVADLEREFQASSSRRCRDAVETLRTRYGLEDASPFSYLVGGSSALTVCCEPRQFLTVEEQRTFPSAAFYGSLPADTATKAKRAREQAARRPGRGTRLFVSFGTIIWRYFAAEALAALTVIADTVAELAEVEALISLGGIPVEPERIAQLERPGVRVASWVDQWEELAAADAFVTHNGVASTHEAVVLGVPMLSVPFFGDQPRRAARCQALGLATMLVDTPKGPVSPTRLRQFLAGLQVDDPDTRSAFERARLWEHETLAGRNAVHREILELADRAGSVAYAARHGT